MGEQGWIHIQNKKGSSGTPVHENLNRKNGKQQGCCTVGYVPCSCCCCRATSQAGADKFASCFNNCEQECKASGQGQTFCEMKCDTDCFNKDVAARLKFPINP